MLDSCAGFRSTPQKALIHFRATQTVRLLGITVANTMSAHSVTVQLAAALR